MKKISGIMFISVFIFIGALGAAHFARAALTVGATTLTTSGALTIDGVAGSAYTLGPSTTTGSIAIGGTAQTGTITVGQSSGTNSILMGTGSGATTVSLMSSSSSSSGVVIGSASQIAQGATYIPLWVKNANNTTTLPMIDGLFQGFSNASGALGDVWGMSVTGGLQNNSSKTITNLYGISAFTNITGDNTTATNEIAGYFSPQIGGGMTNPVITNMIALEAFEKIISGSGIAVTNAYGLKVDSPSFGAGTISNLYGVYIDDQTASGAGTVTTKYNLYSNGATAQNYFAGKVAIGTTTFNSPLNVNGNISLGTNASHIISTQTSAPTPSVTGTGYSGASLVANSTDLKGGITATVGANAGTLVVTFQTAYGTAPICTVSPATATAQVDVGKMYVTTTTGALTLNFVATPTGGSETWNYICIQ